MTKKDVQTGEIQEAQAPPSGARLQNSYEELYYQEGLGPPYRRGEPHWSEFFGGIAVKIVEQLKPRTALDAGCAIGFLVEELRRRGVDARGVDASEWAISQVPEELRSFFKVASLTEELDGDYDLITCFEVLEHMKGHEAEDAVANLCRHTDTILFSSTPTDFEEPTHVNVQTGDYWIGLFGAQGFFRDLDYDASFVAQHAVLLRRKSWSVVDAAKEYERAWWQAHQVAEGARTTRDQLAHDILDLQGQLEASRLQFETLMAEHERAAAYMQELAEFTEGVKSLLSVEQAKVQLLQAQLEQVGKGGSEELIETKARLAESLRELDALRNTKVFRYSSGLRQAYGRARRGQQGGSHPASGEHSPAPEEPPPAYADWIERYRPTDSRAQRTIEEALGRHDDLPLISVVMPVFNPSEHHLRAAIDSVRGQWYERWELCIADDASTEEWVPGVLAEYESIDPRISVVRLPENGHIAAATNSALEMATGTFVGFLDHDDALAEEALALVALATAELPDAGLFYSDEDKLDSEGSRSDPYFKPAWDPLLLVGQNYLTHFLVVRRDVLGLVGGLRTGFEGAQDWDLAYRVTEHLRADQIVHIPHVLYHWRLHPQSTSSSQAAKPYAARAALRAAEEHLSRMGTEGQVGPLGRIGYQRVHWALPDEPPKVSIVIPTRDGPRLQRCLESLRYRTTYPNYEILVVDNGSTDLALLQYLADRAFEIRIIRDSRPFNYPGLNNAAVREAQGSVICLLNDDVEIITDNWLEEMVGQLLQPEIGIVGAKLYFGDGRIQHAGVVLGLGGVAGHGFRYFDSLYFGHFGHTVLPRMSSAVTAACMVTRRELWDELGGLDEQLAVSYNDVDYCLRAAQAGWKTAWTPFAELTHFESTSRKPDVDAANVLRARAEFDFMVDRWGEWLRQDPAYNPNLTLDHEDYQLSWPPRIGRTEACRPRHRVKSAYPTGQRPDD